MSMSRKEFFRQGFFSLGRTAVDIAATIRGTSDPVFHAALSEDAPSAEPRPDMVAEPFNERCLARNCGCFACAERCEPQAILVVPGEGIRVDGALCNGCGTCEYVCPVNPKAVILSPRGKT
jgi:MinD superfamily P-loop ATPase